jgi:hypothetical protein
VNAVITVLACVGGVVAFDWLATGRMASMATSFDYRYWPPTKLRIFSLVLVAIAAATTVLSPASGRQNTLDWTLLFAIFALGTWWLVTLLDFMAQRRTGYREPSRYSDTDY